MELGKNKESKLIIGLIKAGIVISVFFLILQVYALMNECDLVRTREIIEPLDGYYEFEPNSVFSKESRERFESYTTEKIEENNAVIYTEYLARWATESDVEILRLQPYVFSKQTDVKVYTYINPMSFENAWDDFTLPLKEGRWFDGDKDEVICINDSSYEIGDVIQIVNDEGKSLDATVVGKTSYPYLYNNISMSGNLSMGVYKFDNTECVVLLNPQSVYNQKSDLINYRITLIKTENEAFISKISEYGICIPIKDMLIKQKADFLTPVLIMGISILVFGFLVVAEFILKCYKGTDWCTLLAGIFAYLFGKVLYVEVEYKLIVAGIICTLIILIGFLLTKFVNRERKQISNCDIILMNTEDMEE